MFALWPISPDLYLPSLPSIGAAVAAGTGGVQWTRSVFLAGFAVSQLVYGAVSDRFGRRPVILGGVALYLLASLACMVAPSIEVLILARFVQAVGACVGPAIGRAAVRDIYGREQNGRAACRERVCQYVEISVVAGALTKKKIKEKRVRSR